jgi:hypothetical protein
MFVSSTAILGRLEGCPLGIDSGLLRAYSRSETGFESIVGRDSDEGCNLEGSDVMTCVYAYRSATIARILTLQGEREAAGMIMMMKKNRRK